MVPGWDNADADNITKPVRTWAKIIAQASGDVRGRLMLEKIRINFAAG